MSNTPQEAEQTDSRPQATGRQPDLVARRFGQHVRSCRRARGLTQEALAECTTLSADTIRRLEHGSFSPSYDTLRKLCGGLKIELSTLFYGFELGERTVAQEVADALGAMTTDEQDALLRFVRALCRLAGSR